MARRKNVDAYRKPGRKTAKVQGPSADPTQGTGARSERPRSDVDDEDFADAAPVTSEDAIDLDTGDAAAGLAETDTLDADAAAERIVTSGELDEDAREELGIDNIVGPREAGVGGGLDEQEEAIAGITDEEIARKSRRR